MLDNRITFSFGENWKEYLNTVDVKEIEGAKLDIEKWLGKDQVKGKSVVDIGSGSGIHSLSFYLLEAKRIYSFDFDKHSVDATKSMWSKAKCPKNWHTSQGSILNFEEIGFPSKFDIVYSWGVLHHTGDMWQALKNSAKLVKPGGILWISIYGKGPEYEKTLALKYKYNSASLIGKKIMIYKAILLVMAKRVLKFKNPFLWNQKVYRGMNIYHDIVDWLGGLPYEVASDDEILVFFRKLGFELERIDIQGEGACNNFVFKLAECNENKK